jgi:hypothetical protein
MLGVKVPNLAGLAIAAFALLWKFRRRIPEQDTLALLVGISLLFGYAHSYDLVVLAPLVPALRSHLCYGL